MIFVDTSVLIDFLRGSRTPAAERLAQLETDGVPFGIPMICYQEVLQGARDQREWRLLDEYLKTQRLLAPDGPLDLHHDAARIYFECRRRGITVRGTVDCLIAAQVIRAQGTLLHDDDDFERMSAVRGLKTIRG
jgi:predicted nucleic acid-binding protein